MGIIHVMDPHLSNMIAAGEVVDRPVNIVKECVENALDAGATSISVEVFEGGIKGLVITDDGCGMDEEDAQLAFARHATSKLYDEADLFNIQTMGFRGEALASIAAVAEVDLKTSNQGKGTHIHYEYGELTQKEPVSCPRGTRIEVRGLFVHTPARFKYLKRAAYEFSIIAETMNKLAIAHPNIRFVLKHDGRLIFQTSGKGDKKEILFQMFGKDTAMNALPFYGRTDDFEIEGLAVQPKINRANKHFIYLTINDRLVRNYPITNAVIEGYREYLPPERFPIVFLNVKVDPKLVDVNVHPNKLEVRLTKEEYLAQLIINTMENLFSSSLRTVEVDAIKKPKPVQENLDLEYGTRKIGQGRRNHQNNQLQDRTNSGSIRTKWVEGVSQIDSQPMGEAASGGNGAIQYPAGINPNNYPGSKVQTGINDHSEWNNRTDQRIEMPVEDAFGVVNPEGLHGHPGLQSTGTHNFEQTQNYVKEHQLPVKPLIDDLKNQYGGKSPISASTFTGGSFPQENNLKERSRSVPEENSVHMFPSNESSCAADPEFVTSTRVDMERRNQSPLQNSSDPDFLAHIPVWHKKTSSSSDTVNGQETDNPSTQTDQSVGMNDWICDSQDTQQKTDLLSDQSQEENPNIQESSEENQALPDPSDFSEDMSSDLNRQEFPAECSAQSSQDFPEQKARGGNAFFEDLKIIGQLKKSYILCENAEGLVIIDQHAAQERYHFEQLQDAFARKVEFVQPLVVPMRIRVTPDLYARVEAINEMTEFYGLHFEAFSGNSLVLRSEPAWLQKLDSKKFLEDMLAGFHEEGIIDIQKMHRHMIATAACHSSIRFNRTLCMEEMEQVITDLCKCHQPFHCPHGRPTVITLSDSRMRKEFERG